MNCIGLILQEVYKVELQRKAGTLERVTSSRRFRQKCSTRCFGKSCFSYVLRWRIGATRREIGKAIADIPVVGNPSANDDQHPVYGFACDCSLGTTKPPADTNNC